LAMLNHYSSFRIANPIDGQVCLVRLVRLHVITSLCFFVNKRTNDKLPFT
jgi:hypothetical protein